MEELETRRMGGMDNIEFQEHRKVLEHEFNTKLTDLSVSNQVLHATTALIAKKKITDVHTGEK